jgi:methyltransferase (TIGR00027 family)
MQAAIAAGIEQVLILGAGLDSRACRIPGADRVSVFEVDHPATQAWKLERMRRIGRRGDSHVTYVPVDFERQVLGEALTARGFEPGAPTFALWEGVTQYIGEAAVDETLRFLAGATPRDSRVVFTYVRRGLVDGSDDDESSGEIRAEVERQGEPWIFGIEPSELRSFLAGRGFDLVEDVGAADYRTRYLVPAERELEIFDGERVAVATTRGV